jgi:diacylglycerol kinase (ATP)
MRRRFFLLINTGAGLPRAPLVDQVTEVIRKAGGTVTVSRLADFGALRAATREAARAGVYDAIVAAGGDGTIRHVCASMLGQDIPLGIIPAGTANVLAHEIGLTADPHAVARMLLAGPSAKVACARANHEPFLLMSSAGFDARVVGALDHRLKSRMGKVAYAGPLLGALVRPVDALNVLVDNRRCEASWAVIANARHYGGRFVMAPRAGIKERGLEAILFKASSRSVLVGQLMSLVLGRLDARAARLEDVELVRCTRVTISSHHPVPTQVDGDVLGSTPLEVEAGTEELQLILPPIA